MTMWSITCKSLLNQTNHYSWVEPNFNFHLPGIWILKPRIGYWTPKSEDLHSFLAVDHRFQIQSWEILIRHSLLISRKFPNGEGVFSFKIKAAMIDFVPVWSPWNPYPHQSLPQVQPSFWTKTEPILLSQSCVVSPISFSLKYFMVSSMVWIATKRKEYHTIMEGGREVWM